MKRKYKKIEPERIQHIFDNLLVESTDSDAQEIILYLLPLDLYFGLKRNVGNHETPWRHSLSIFPSPEFALDMDRLDKILNTKQVRFFEKLAFQNI